jgi:hypothetical protein
MDDRSHSQDAQPEDFGGRGRDPGARAARAERGTRTTVVAPPAGSHGRGNQRDAEPRSG